MKIVNALSLSSLIAAALAVGCSSNSDDSSGDTCVTDSSVSCTGNATGYSCGGSDTPDQSDTSLSCSDGTAASNGNTDYCCISGYSSSCMQDDTVSGCTGDSYGFSCTGSDPPDQSDSSLTCSVGVAGSNGDTDYCCVGYSSTTCMQDDTVTGCEGGSFGFSCTGSDSPDQGDSSLNCSSGTAGDNGDTLYCCTN